MREGDRVSVTGEVKAIREIKPVFGSAEGTYLYIKFDWRDSLLIVPVSKVSPVEPREFRITDEDFDLQKTSFSVNLRQARQNINMKQSVLAKILGVSQVTICHWENGGHYPRSARLTAIAQALRTTVPILLGEET